MKKYRLLLIGIIGVACLWLLWVFGMHREVDSIYLNAKVYTMDSVRTVAEAFAVKNGRIVAIGSNRFIHLRYRAKNVVDLQGKTVLPGFIDAHCHFLELGLSKLTVDLHALSGEEEGVTRIQSRLASFQAGEWIRGSGWDQNTWSSRQFPTKHSLDRITPVNPVYLVRVDGHACWVNSLALQRAGITRVTRDPSGGKIVRDASGDPTGVLIDAAMQLVYTAVPPPTETEWRQAVRLAGEECLQFGLTSVQEMDVDSAQVALYRRMIDARLFPVRLYAACDGPNELWKQLCASGPIIGYGDNRLTVRAVKLYVDGALGSHGAAMIDSYTDEPGNRGLTVASSEQLKSMVDASIDHHLQVCTHAIGDRANTIILNVYENALRSHAPGDYRLRVEHAQVLDPNDIPRFAKLGVLASMQPIHCTSDMKWVEAVIGPKRARNAYAWHSLLQSGATIAGGSDFPVESANPLLGIYAACTRKDTNGVPNSAADVTHSFALSPEGIQDATAFQDGWYASQRMTREEAVRCFTTSAAYAAFEEQLKGSLKEGTLADFVVLSGDLFTVPISRIPSLVVEQTYLGGERVFSRDIAFSPKSL